VAGDSHLLNVFFLAREVETEPELEDGQKRRQATPQPGEHSFRQPS